MLEHLETIPTISLRTCSQSLRNSLLSENTNKGEQSMSHEYPSDISREAFSFILPILESVRKRTKPRTVDLYDVFGAILYLLKSGCQWRMLPKDYSVLAYLPFVLQQME